MEERQTRQHTHSDSQTHIWDVLQCDTWTHWGVCDVWTRQPVAAPSLTLLHRTPSAAKGATTWQPWIFITIFSEFNIWKYSIRSDRSDFSGRSRIYPGGLNTKVGVEDLLFWPVPSQKLHEILKEIGPSVSLDSPIDLEDLSRRSISFCRCQLFSEVYTHSLARVSRIKYPFPVNFKLWYFLKVTFFVCQIWTVRTVRF